jgi:hypothetical protein
MWEKTTFRNENYYCRNEMFLAEGLNTKMHIATE